MLIFPLSLLPLFIIIFCFRFFFFCFLFLACFDFTPDSPSLSLSVPLYVPHSLAPQLSDCSIFPLPLCKQITPPVTSLLPSSESEIVKAHQASLQPKQIVVNVGSSISFGTHAEMPFVSD